MRAGFFLALSFLCAVAAEGQSASPKADELPKFEVATMKPNIKGGVIGLLTYPGGRIVCGVCSLHMMMTYAFDVRELQIVGGPSWMDKDRYDVEAIPPEDSPARKLRPASMKAPPTLEQRQMLQSLLVERMGLHYHRETRIGAVYWMLRTKRKFTPNPAKDRDEVPFMSIAVFQGGVGNGEMTGENTTMSYMALRLSSLLRLPVVDKTGIDGSFDFDVPAPEPANADMMTAAIAGLSQLGLKLHEAKGPIEYIVVDGATKPTPN
jgi:uncharacterized protein (TIGR03435 family)